MKHIMLHSQAIAASFIPMVIAMPFSMEVRADDDVYTPKMIIGRTYPIIEKDALKEIEERVENHRFDPKIFGEEEDWSALKSVRLPAATEHKLRQVIPFFALSFDIPDKDGNILYPAGYTFNPLEYLRLPSRLIIVAENQLEWGIQQADIGDLLILAGGNALKAMRFHNRSIFKLEAQVQERLDLRVVPSIVTQEGNHFIVEEILLEDGQLSVPLPSAVVISETSGGSNE